MNFFTPEMGWVILGILAYFAIGIYSDRLANAILLVFVLAALFKIASGWS